MGKVGHIPKCRRDAVVKHKQQKQTYTIYKLKTTQRDTIYLH